MDLKEGCSYVMHNFKVTKNDGQYRVCDHPYKLTFIGVIIVKQCGLDGVPLKKYRFVDFSDIIAGQLQFDLLVGKCNQIYISNFNTSICGFCFPLLIFT